MKARGTARWKDADGSFDPSAVADRSATDTLHAAIFRPFLTADNEKDFS